MPLPPNPRPPSSRPYPKGSYTKRAWSRPLADLVGGAIDPILARHGFSESDLILNWDDIVGERLAANSRPIKLQWPPRQAGQGAGASASGSATLLIRVDGGFALELQHRSDQVLARINSHFGWRCVGRLALRQGPIDRPEVGRSRHPIPSAQAVAAAGAQVADIADEPLRAALTRLGAHILR